MAFDFPSNPSIDQEYVDDASGANYKFDGVTWLRMPSKAAAFEDAPADGTMYGRLNRGWENVLTRAAQTPGAIATIGDVKTGFQAADHMGWVKLDGRATATLSPTQRQCATALGFAVNLPNGANAVLVQNGLAMGAVTGTMSRTLERANLPAFNMTAGVGTDGAHTHPITYRYHTTSGATNDKDFYGWDVTPGTMWGGPLLAGMSSATGNQTGTVSENTMDSAGGHTHSVPSGGTGVAIDITPRSISCNMFLYLGT